MKTIRYKARNGIITHLDGKRILRGTTDIVERTMALALQGKIKLIPEKKETAGSAVK